MIHLISLQIPRLISLDEWVKYEEWVFRVRVNNESDAFKFYEFWIDLMGLECIFVGYFPFVKSKNSAYLLLKIVII